MMIYVTRSKIDGRIDIVPLSPHEKAVDYCRSVLQWIVAVVKCLASRSLAFREENEIIGS